MDRRGFLKSGLAVSAVVVITKAVDVPAEVFDASDPPFADIDTDSVKVIGPIFGETDIQLRAYHYDALVWEGIVKMPTMMDFMGDSETLIVLPHPESVDIVIDKTIYVNKLTAALPDFPVEAELFIRDMPMPLFFEAGDMLTLQSDKEGLLRLMSDAEIEKLEAEVLA